MYARAYIYVCVIVSFSMILRFGMQSYVSVMFAFFENEATTSSSFDRWNRALFIKLNYLSGGTKILFV